MQRKVAGCLKRETLDCDEKLDADPSDERMQWICAILTGKLWVWPSEVHAAIWIAGWIVWRRLILGGIRAGLNWARRKTAGRGNLRRGRAGAFRIAFSVFALASFTLPSFTLSAFPYTLS